MSFALVLFSILALPFFIIWLTFFILLNPQKKINVSIIAGISIFFLVALTLFGSFIFLSPYQHYAGAAIGPIVGGIFSLFFLLNSLIAFGILKFRKPNVTRNEVVAIIFSTIAAGTITIITVKSIQSITGLIIASALIQALFWFVWNRIRLNKGKK